MTNMTKIRVMIVDDHDKVRLALGLSLLAFDDFQVVGEAMNGAEAVYWSAELKPDIIVMDLHMPILDGVTAISLIRQDQPQINIIALTGLDDKQSQQAAFRAGADICLHKNITMDELAAAIRSASTDNTHQGCG